MFPTLAVQSFPLVFLAVGILVALLCGAGLAPTIQELRQKHAQLVDNAKALIAKADAEKRDLTDDETGQVEKHTSEAKELKAQIAAAERRQKLRGDVGDLAAALDVNPGRKSFDPSGAIPMGAPIIAIEAWRNDPKRGYRRAEDQLVEVMRVARGARPSAQLESLRAAAGSDEQTENASPYGDFLLAPAFQPTVLQVEAEMDPIAGLVQKVPMAMPTVRIPARVDKKHNTSVSGGLQVFRRASSEDVQKSRIKFKMVELRADSLMGVSIAEEELLSDSPISFAAILSAGFRDEFAARKLQERISGTGAGEFQGVLESACLITVDAEEDQDPDTFTYQNAIDMRARCWGYNRAVWLYNHDLLPQLMKMVIPVGTGGVPAWVTSAREDRPDTFMGRPAFPTEFCKTAGDVGDVILGNWSQYLEGELEGTQAAESTHVRFDTHERAFKFWQRNAAAPWWEAPLTPKNSAKTLSPFVVCAGR